MQNTICSVSQIEPHISKLFWCFEAFFLRNWQKLSFRSKNDCLWKKIKITQSVFFLKREMRQILSKTVELQNELQWAVVAILEFWFVFIGNGRNQPLWGKSGYLRISSDLMETFFLFKQVKQDKYYRTVSYLKLSHIQLIVAFMEIWRFFSRNWQKHTFRSRKLLSLKKLGITPNSFYLKECETS